MKAYNAPKGILRKPMREQIKMDTVKRFKRTREQYRNNSKSPIGYKAIKELAQ